MIALDPPLTSRRREDRHRIDLVVAIRGYRMAPRDGHMLDISPGGAMVAVDHDGLVRGDEIVLAAGGIDAVATIAWLTEGHCGLAFHRSLSPSDIAHLRRIGRTPGHR